MTETVVAPVRSRRVGSADLVWVALRQHRGLILSTVGGLVLLCGYMLWTGLTSTGDLNNPVRCDLSCAPLNLFGVSPDRYELAKFETTAVAGIGLVIAMFWAAPLLAAEYERRTSLLAWSQDVRPVRWLVGKVVPMAVIAAALAAGTGELAAWVGNRVQFYAKFETFNFEAFGPVQIGYALFGFALGLLASAVFRRVLPALAAAGVLYVLTRWGIDKIRPFYETPVRRVDRFVLADGGVAIFGVGPADGLEVNSGYATANGQPIDFDGNCTGPVNSATAYQNCLHAHGVFGRYTDYQPASRLLTFQMIETGIFVGLAAVLFTLSWLRVRRQNSVT